MNDPFFKGGGLGSGPYLFSKAQGNYDIHPKPKAMELKESIKPQQAIQELKSRMSASIIGQDQL